MTPAENRRRLAALRAGEDLRDQGVAPGLSGAEVVALRRLSGSAGASATNRGHTQHPRGWQSMHAPQLRKGAA